MRNSDNFKENGKAKCHQVHQDRKMQSDAKKDQKYEKYKQIKKIVVGCIKVKGWKDTEKWRLDHWTA